MENYCDNTKKHFDIKVDIKNIDTDLCESWFCLETAVAKLPESMVKQYFIFKILECAKLNSASGLYHVKNNVFRMIGIAIQEDLDGKILMALEAIREALKKIINYVESEKVF